MSDALKIAKGVKPEERIAFQDAPSHHIANWQWRPLEDVQEELGLHEIPSHVHEFGKFMDRTAERAAREGLTPRDLIKAYTITRASIQRRATPAENLRKSGLILPDDVEGMVRPEGAFGHWLHTPAGQSYLDAAQRGRVHESAIADAVKRMAPFGRHETDIPDSLRWAAQNLPDKAAAVSHLVAAGRENASTPKEWRDFVTNIRGIGPSKAGFVASLMGRGDQPTLDARQIVLHTGKPSKEAAPHIARKGGAGGAEAVDRLAARQEAMNLKTPEGMKPYYQHLAHHAVWDKAGNEQTTHQDVIDAMQHAADGGEIYDHPVHMVMRAIHPKGYKKGGTPTPAEIADQQWVDNAMREHTLRQQMGMLATGGSVRRPYKKGGKFEGAIWHERDAFAGGGDPLQEMSDWSDKFGGEEIQSPFGATPQGQQTHLGGQQHFLEQMGIQGEPNNEPIQHAEAPAHHEETPDAFIPAKHEWDFPQTYKDIMNPEPQMDWTKGMTPREQAPSESLQVGVQKSVPRLSIREQFNNAFADAAKKGLKEFTWTNPKTGKSDIYPVKYEKSGGRTLNSQIVQQALSKARATLPAHSYPLTGNATGRRR